MDASTAISLHHQFDSQGFDEENKGEGLAEGYGACAICMERIVIHEAALVKGCEHAYWINRNLGMGVESESGATQQPIITTEATADQIQALLEAARYDDIDDVVNIHSMGVSLDVKDSNGRTALHMAAANGNLYIVEYLIGNGVDVNASNLEKNTPLHWACLNGHIEVIKALIQGGAAVSALNSYERTPMDEALNSGKMEVVDAISTAVAQVEMEGVSVS